MLFRLQLLENQEFGGSCLFHSFFFFVPEGDVSQCFLATFPFGGLGLGCRSGPWSVCVSAMVHPPGPSLELGCLLTQWLAAGTAGGSQPKIVLRQRELPRLTAHPWAACVQWMAGPWLGGGGAETSVSFLDSEPTPGGAVPVPEPQLSSFCLRDAAPHFSRSPSGGDGGGHPRNPPAGRSPGVGGSRKTAH